MILKHVMSGICTKMNRTKQLPNDIMETPLNRCLNTFDITLLGNFIIVLIVFFYTIKRHLSLTIQILIWFVLFFFIP